MRNQRGFTLLEVLVATTILAFAVAGVLSALSTSMRNAARLTEYDRAALLGRHKMDEILVDKKLPRYAQIAGEWDPMQTNGRRMGWRAQISPWELPPGAGPGTEILERVQLEVWWEDGDRRRTFPLEGFRRGMLTPNDIAAGALMPR